MLAYRDRPPDRPLCIPVDILNALLAQGRREAPRECCGFLAGRGALVAAIFPMRNVAPRPTTRYDADPADLIRGHVYLRTRRLDLLAIYHSHPTSAAVPSRTDLRLNGYGATPHLIVSLRGSMPKLRAWRLAAESFEELPWWLVPAAAPRLGVDRWEPTD